MKYALILGRVHTLSIAEIYAVLAQPSPLYQTEGNKITVLTASPEAMVIETEKPILTEPLLRHLGGVIKICRVVDVVEKREQDSVNFALKHYFKPSVLKKEFLKDYKGKIQFGVSLYVLEPGLANPPVRTAPGERPQFTVFGEPKRIGLTVKSVLTEGGASVRCVLPEFNALSLASVVVTKNLLLQKGCEIVLLVSKKHIFVCKTTAVQDFEDYGRRDYQRPVRDDKMGMIPPKVAQIMLNLSGAAPGQTVLDPFCGIGTIVQEGLLQGYRMLGSDLNPVAVKGAEVNLEWFRNRYKIAPGKYSLEVSDVGQVSKLIELGGQTVNHIVTEGTLGPVYGKFPRPEDMKKNFKDLAALYVKAFTEFAKFLPAGGKVVMCVPAYKHGRDQYILMENLDFIPELGYTSVDTVSPELQQKFGFLKASFRGTAIYDRKDQIVAREIVIFQKN